MVTIYIENKPYEVKEGQNLLQACLSLGFDVPYFCWHPALGSVGACRQCAVKQFKDERDTVGRIVMSCMTPVAKDLRISINDPEVRNFRAAIIECLMTNHPHDCPICDEGGECHLQDMTVMTGHNYRKYRFTKRTYQNQNLGPFINHEMNRCIQCYRCVRYYRDYAGGRDFGAFASHNHVYFGRHEDGTLESEFSGNLVEVCPTGVFTDKSLKQHYTRSWDLQTAPSVCVHCGLGCNVTPGERYGGLRRIRNRYNGAVNGYFLCDRGRYGYEFVNGPNRIRQPLRQAANGADSVPAPRGAVVADVGQVLRSAKGVIGIGSPRASVESNFALCTLVGTDNFFAGISEQERALVAEILKIMQTGPARTPSLGELADADAVLVLGEDVTNVAPLMDLQIRQAIRNEPLAISRKLRIPDWDDNPVREAIQNQRGPLFIASVAGAKLDEVATDAYHAAPDDIARLGFAVAHAIDPQAPAVPGLSVETQRLADQIAQALTHAQKPLIVSGPSCASLAIIRSAAQVASALCAKTKSAALAFTMPECNTAGLALLAGRGLEDAVARVTSGQADTVVIVENDLYRRAPRELVDALFTAAKHTVAIDHTVHATIRKAKFVLPAATFVEGDGTLINNEGRAQRFIQVMSPQGDVTESWRSLIELGRAAGNRELDGWQTLDSVQAALAESVPALAPVREVAPSAGTRFVGARLPRQPHRYSGRTAMNAHKHVSERKIPEDPDSPFTFSMEGFRGQVPSSVIPSTWTPGWNSVQSLTRFQEEIGGPLRGGDPGIRLIETNHTDGKYAAEIPPAFQPRAGEFLAVPLYHIYGSEELSAQSPPVAERSVAPYIALHPEDAAALGVAEGATASLSLNRQTCSAPVCLCSTLPRGVAGVPAGHAALPIAGLPAWGKLERGERK